MIVVGILAGGRRRVSGSPPVVAENGITFGAYPYLVESTLNVPGVIPETTLRENGQTDFDNLNIQAGFPEVTMQIVSNYLLHTLNDVDNLNVGTSAPEATMIFTSNYVEHSLTDTDNLNTSVSSPEGVLTNLPVIFHSVYDVDSVNISVSALDIMLT